MTKKNKKNSMVKLQKMITENVTNSAKLTVTFVCLAV